MKIYYIAGGEMHSFDTDTQASSYISSPVLEDYRKRVRENAKRNEWKHAGSGAAFLSEGGEKALSPEEAVMQIRAGIHALYVTEDAMDYALSIDDICGIYKHRPKEAQDGIIISDSNMRYTFFAKEPKSGRLAVCCEFAGEIHLGLLLPGGKSLFPDHRRFKPGALALVVGKGAGSALVQRMRPCRFPSRIRPKKAEILSADGA